MNDTSISQSSVVERFRALHASGCFVLPNPWDVGSAVYLEQLGFKAARAAIDESEIPVMLTARCEAWLVGQPDPARVALERLVAFAEAGADCLYAPGVSQPDEIAAIVKAVSPKPVNVLVSRFNSD